MTDIQLNYRDHVAEILLASPEQSNTMDDELSRDMLETLESLGRNDDVHAIILGSTGGIFSAGGDLDMLHELAADSQHVSQHPKLQHALRASMRVVEKLWDFPKPTIAAVEGPCIGAGIGWVAACDVRLASERSFFDTAYMKLGLGTDFGVAWLLTHAVGAGRARDWILRPRRISATEAQASGFLGEVIPTTENLLDAAHASATLLTRATPELIQSVRQNVRDAAELPLSEALDLEAQRFITHLPSANIPVTNK